MVEIVIIVHHAKQTLIKDLGAAKTVQYTRPNRWAYATYTLLPMHEIGQISMKNGSGLILRHGRIIRILRYIIIVNHIRLSFYIVSVSMYTPKPEEHFFTIVILNCTMISHIVNTCSHFCWPQRSEGLDQVVDHDIRSLCNVYLYSTLKANSVLPAGVPCTTLFCYYAEQVMASKIDVIISEQEPNSSLERASTLVSSVIPPIYKWLLYVMILPLERLHS